MANLPVVNARISQEYGRKNTLYKKGYHTGIDIVANDTDKSIYAFASGNIIRARYSPGTKGADADGWGNYAIVRQDDGRDILYAHLALVAVTEGQKIKKGEKLGVEGSTGKSTGLHLHFEVWNGSWENRNDINAADYLGIKNAVGLAVFNNPYENDRAWAIEQGISDGSDPDRPVLRKEVWAMLRRMGRR